jgi:hypothetical protein
MSEAKFEKHVDQAVRGAVAATEGNKEIIAEARAIQQDEKRQHREIRERALAARTKTVTSTVWPSAASFRRSTTCSWAVEWDCRDRRRGN